MVLKLKKKIKEKKSQNCPVSGSYPALYLSTEHFFLTNMELIIYTE